MATAYRERVKRAEERDAKAIEVSTIGKLLCERLRDVYGPA